MELLVFAKVLGESGSYIKANVLFWLQGASQFEMKKPRS
jgi:hypothetical protein